VSDEPLFGPEQPKYLFVQPRLDRVACVERVVEDRRPAIRSTARTRCLWCDHWCWLGDKSTEMILSGGAAPMCHECAKELLPGNAIPIGSIKDTLWDGPR
jgi:hypothetical protein